MSKKERKMRSKVSEKDTWKNKIALVCEVHQYTIKCRNNFKKKLLQEIKEN